MVSLARILLAGGTTVMSRPLTVPPRYTVQDSMGWNDERRYALIDGEV